MADTITIRGMRGRADRFLACQTFDQLARLLGKQPLQLIGLAAHPQYREFYIPKKSGGKRLIEDPVPPLKKAQRRLNDYLQAVYYFHRTASAYGFLTNPVDDPQPRHILTNAGQHLGRPWMLNVDMKDFFHQITQERAQELFKAPIFGFNDEISTALAALCCYKGRLPMGAPTSPILSNLASIPLDQDMEDYARDRGWVYTRYADDMTFSANEPITEAHFREIENWITAYDFILNPTKKRFYGPDDKKEVTGLVVGDSEVELADDYLDMLTGAIQHFSDIVDAQHLTPSGKNQPSPWVTELQAQVKGKLEFARQILGENDERFIDLETRLIKAAEPPESYGPLTWLEFGYDVKL